MIKVKNLMVLERLLLEIDLKYKFNLSFAEAYKLYDFLRNISRITDYVFLIQEEYGEKVDDNEKLKKYHNKIMESNIEFNSVDIIKFIEDISNVWKDKEYDKLISNVKFW